MAPHAGAFDPEKIKEKARKDILYLLEGVSKAVLSDCCGDTSSIILVIGPREEESGD